MGKKFKDWVNDLKEKRQDRKEKREERREERRENREERREERQENREERRENMKEAFENAGDKIKDAAGKLFDVGHNVVDEIWQGETDAAKEKRLEKEAKEAAETKQMIYDYAIYAGVGAVVLIGIFMMTR